MALTSSTGTTSPQAGGLRRMFAPQAIAVIGASASADKAGGALLRVLASFPGRLYPVNPNTPEIGGRTSYRSVRDVPAKVDLAVIAVPPSAVADTLVDCGRAGVGAAVVCTGGFAESGDGGAALQDEIAQLARQHGIRLLGPNTSGFLAPGQSLFATFMPTAQELAAGGLGIVAQSGGANLALAFLASERGAGISLAVGLGNAVDVGFVDVLDYLAGDEATAAVMLHIEGVAEGRALMASLARLSAVKPVVAMKVGKADTGDFARSHTGALAGDWAVTRAALEQAGAVVVESLTDLVDAAVALSVTRLPAGADPGVGIVTGQAGPGLIIADALASAGVSVPALTPPVTEALDGLLPPITYQRNPVDTGRPDTTFLNVITVVGGDPGIDALLVYALHEKGTAGVIDALADQAWRGLLPPTLMATGGPGDILARQRHQLNAAGVPLVSAPDRAAFVMSAMVADARAQHRLRQAAHDFAVGVPAERIEGTGALDEADGKAWLERLAIATPARRVCADESQALAALADLGGPVVVKVLDAQVTHKSAVGGVRLGVTTRDEMREALRQTARATAGQPRWLVEEQVPSGIELLVGGMRDSAFGPVVVLGAGGVGVEWGAPPVIRAAPLSRAEADAAVAALPAALVRALGPDRCAELAEIVRDVSAFLAAHPEIGELDINPIRATGSGFVALDAVFVLTDPQGDDAPGTLTDPAPVA